MNKALRDDFMMLTAPSIRSHVTYWRPVLEQKSNDRFFSIYADNNHVGNCGIKSIQENLVGEIWIYLGDPSVRGQGIGSVALARLKRQARIMHLAQLILHVKHDNHRAKGLYRKEGFRAIKTGPARSFGFAVDALICKMSTSL